jgi:glycogen synthase
VTVERDPAKAGGLGEVSKTIPRNLNLHMGADVRVLMPALKPVLAEGGWESTGERAELALAWDGEPSHASFELLQKFDETNKTWVYAIENERYFGRFPHLYFRGNREASLGPDPIFNTVMMFNRAAALFAPRLDRGASRSPHLHAFDGPCDFVMCHDWLTGAFLALAPPTWQVGKIFMLHNTYDEQRDIKTTQKALLGGCAISPNTWGNFSPLETGVWESHIVIANQNYVRSLFQRDSFDLLLQNLSDKISRGLLYDMHHGVSSTYSAEKQPVLESDGFVTFHPPSEREEEAFFDAGPEAENTQLTGYAPRLQAMLDYKSANKSALQKMLGLEVNPDAIIYSWVGRFDPLQKGFYLVMEEARTFLRRQPQVQWIIAGANSNNDSFIREFIDNALADAELRGRLSISDQFVTRDKVIRICAGSDFFLMPSMYEPFGLAQLEAMKLGSIPIVHGVDGLRSTVSDPEIDRLDVDDEPRERVADYGQVGVKIEFMNVPLYHAAISRQAKGEALTQQERWALNDSQRKLRMALGRSLRLHANTERRLSVIDGGMRFVNAEHSWPSIIRRYELPIRQAVAAGRQIAMR